MLLKDTKPTKAEMFCFSFTNCSFNTKGSIATEGRVLLNEFIGGGKKC